MFKYSGLIPEDDPLHTPLPVGIADLAELVSDPFEGIREHFERAELIVAPYYVAIGRRKIPQWSPTVSGEVRGFNPAHDCEGNFMSYKYQPNNNCYNYACNIATNSFAQPGRLHGISVLNGKDLDPDKVVDGAVGDRLKLIGQDLFPMDKLASLKLGKGHFVALLTSNPDKSIGWRGDFHWVRSDNDQCTSWSQKYGPDQVVNFDFAGMPIVDPTQANWEINEGPQKLGGKTAIKVTYEFQAWMFVPYDGVNII
jgi:hypothetical protein